MARNTNKSGTNVIIGRSRRTSATKVYVPRGLRPHVKTKPTSAGTRIKTTSKKS